MSISIQLQNGSQGSQVQELQRILGITADGIFGPKTKQAVINFQKSKGLVPDGIVGPKTIQALGGTPPSTAQSSSSNSGVNVNDARTLTFGQPFQGGTVKFDTETGRPLNIGETTPATPTGSVNNTGNIQDVDKYINDILESVIKSGKVINPNITQEDLDKIDPAVFLAQAENSIAPEYKEKFAVLKEGLSKSLSNIGYDLTKKEEAIGREATQTLDQGTEDLAGRGLAFSGAREKFVTDVDQAKSREIESARVAAERLAQENLSGVESKVGTEALKGFGINPAVGGRTLSFSGTPLTGSLVSERQYLKESMAKELERQERERRAYARGSLTFA
jgi:peptidoglycan hydrolase-like protein with peptidoglycan-binding domain